MKKQQRRRKGTVTFNRYGWNQLIQQHLCVRGPLTDHHFQEKVYFFCFLLTFMDEEMHIR